MTETLRQRILSTPLPSFLTDEQAWKLYLSDNWLVLDFETTNKEYGFAGNKSNHLLLSTWSTNSGKVEYDESSEFDQRRLREAISRASFLVAQNAKFEIQWLIRMGVAVESLVWYDTMLGEYVLAGNLRTKKDLDSLCLKYGVATKPHLVKKMMESGICPSEIPRKLLIEYGMGDSENTAEVFLHQRLELNNFNLLPVLWTRCLTTPVLAEIEMQGMYANKEKVYAEYTKCVEAHTSAAEEVTRVTGGINLRSPKQVSALLYDELNFSELQFKGEPSRTDKGGRRTDEDAITALKADTERQREVQSAFLRAKPLEKLLDTLTKLKGCVDEDGGLLYGTLNQAVTQTHRLSSSGKRWKLQFQNFDRDLKHLFSPRNSGWKFGEADGSSLEFRGAGQLGHDDTIKNDIRKGVDPHRFTGSVIFKVPEEKVTSAQRTDSKPYTFKPLYGGMSGTTDEVRYYKAFRKKYSQLFETQTGWTYDVLKNKRLVTEWGLIFYWPDTTLSRSGYISNTTSIFNYPIQSFCTAEIIPISLVYFWHRAKRLGLRLFLVNTVHDSICAELPPEEEGVFRELSNHCFTRDTFEYLRRNYGIKMEIPLGCETKVGDYWGKGEGVKYECDPEHIREEIA